MNVAYTSHILRGGYTSFSFFRCGTSRDHVIRWYGGGYGARGRTSVVRVSGPIFLHYQGLFYGVPIAWGILYELL